MSSYGLVVKVADLGSTPTAYPYESLVAAGRASGQDCCCVPQGRSQEFDFGGGIRFN